MGREGWGGSEWGPGEHWCLGAVPNPLANAGDICHQLQEGKSKKRSCAKCTEFLDSGRLCWFCYHFPCNPTNLGSNLTLKHFPGSYQEKDLKVSCFIPSSYFYPKFCLFVCCCFLCVILFFFSFLLSNSRMFLSREGGEQPVLVLLMFPAGEVAGVEKRVEVALRR